LFLCALDLWLFCRCCQPALGSAAARAVVAVPAASVSVSTDLHESCC